MKIGLIGFGTIGKAVTKAVDSKQVGDVEITQILVRDIRKIDADFVGRERVTSDPARFFADDIEVVVEAAGHAASSNTQRSL